MKLLILQSFSALPTIGPVFNPWKFGDGVPCTFSCVQCHGYYGVPCMLHAWGGLLRHSHHLKLLMKLDFYGISSDTTRCILIKQLELVCVNGQCSDWSPVVVSGSYLIVLHINDSYEMVTSTRRFRQLIICFIGQSTLLKTNQNFNKTLAPCSSGPSLGACILTHPNVRPWELQLRDNQVVHSTTSSASP